MAQQDITEPIYFGGGYVKKFSSILGFNSQPSNVDITIVVDTENGQEFDEDGLLPGNISGLRIGAFDFTGIIQSWYKNYGTNGIEYDIKMSDPRLMFGDIYLIMNGAGSKLPTITNIANGSGVENLINIYDYYGTDISAEYNNYGMTWNKIKAVLDDDASYINIYGKRFRLDFDDGFDAPSFLRINADEGSLEEVLSQASERLGVDYIVNIVDYDPNASFNTIEITTISRQQDSLEGVEIDNYIQEKQDTKTLIGYKRGKELRGGPTTAVVEGSNYSYLYSTDDGIQCWGKTGDGIVVTAASNTANELSQFNPLYPYQEWGFVSFETIVADNPTLLQNLPTLQLNGRQRYPNSLDYPTLYNQDNVSQVIRGYRPTENVLRAALHSKESWEAVLYAEQLSVANTIGINAWYLRKIGTSEVNRISYFGGKYRITPIDADNLYRTAKEAALIDIIYNLTREQAEAHYGKTFLVSLPFDATHDISGPFNASKINPRYGYKVVDSVYTLNISSNIRKSYNSNFQTEDGGLKAHVKLSDIRSNNIPIVVDPILNNTQFPTDKPLVDISLIDRSQYIIDNNDIVVSCSVEQDSTNLARAIVNLPNPIIYENNIDEKYRSSYVEFFRSLGYTEKDIFTGWQSLEVIDPGSIYRDSYVAPSGGIPAIVSYQELYPELGLAPKRITEGLRFYIPLENHFNKYGPYIAKSDRIGGVILIRDDSLNPYTFNTDANVETAGRQIAQNAITTTTVMDFGQLSVAGLPEFNLGDKLGINSNITSIDISVGQDGLITNYNLQTYALPPYRLSRLLNDKIVKTNIKMKESALSTIKLEDKIKELSNQLTDGVFNLGTKDNFKDDDGVKQPRNKVHGNFIGTRLKPSTRDEDTAIT